ncbi:TetR family transcriptional regulator C-terminal domain-containing protein [Mycolicibacterium sp. NCC-Tsukiji]|uniref:TetR family transcriptional regulator C-terminal domain-containing protein n=1 Tax=Mycolicibacterium sp. NCC-Tsukiji TaxID=2185272 RepID=UPI000EC61A17|nr:TetR family transcriptional regulator C-terminal domain-containing protein [Mycolicibacterium sp. NCC-Tsukiji]GCA99257.1 hypothetical protein NCCNTM_28920 [Mycolicibacterium sp. NCC-Tsukiji]
MHRNPDDLPSALLETQRRQLSEVTSVSCFDAWRDSLVATSGRSGDPPGGALGVLIARLADRNEGAREEAASYFAGWHRLLATTMRRLQDRGRLHHDADPEALATGLVAGVQGGYLRARASGSPHHLLVAIEMALAHIRSFADQV